MNLTEETFSILICGYCGRKATICCYIFRSLSVYCGYWPWTFTLSNMKAYFPLFSKAFSSVEWRVIVGQFHWVLFRMHDRYLMEIVTKIEQAVQYFMFSGCLSAWWFVCACLHEDERNARVFPSQDLTSGKYLSVFFSETLALMLRLTPQVS